jgi:8-oxo-dGTP diphosphatase
MKEKTTRYTVGFMFSEDESQVILLQRKSKPGMEWMAGKWNGVGGHVEDGETSYECMAREFEEEAGIKTKPEDWTHYAVLIGQGYDVSCFFSHYSRLWECSQKEEQEVRIFSTNPYGTSEPYLNVPLMHNLKFLIPLALNCSDIFKPVWFFGAVGD